MLQKNIHFHLKDWKKQGAVHLKQLASTCTVFLLFLKYTKDQFYFYFIILFNQMESRQFYHQLVSTPGNPIFSTIRSFPELGVLHNNSNEPQVQQCNYVNWPHIIGREGPLASPRQGGDSNHQIKYSFRRPLGNSISTIANPELNLQQNIGQLNQYKTWLAQKQKIIGIYQGLLAEKDIQIAQIRDISHKILSKFQQSYSPSAENVNHINGLIQIHNTSIYSDRNKYSELPYVNLNEWNQRWVCQQHNIPSINIGKKQTKIPLPQLNSQRYFLSVGELKSKIQLLQKQKITLTDKIKGFEQNTERSNSTIQTYKCENQNLQIKLREVNDLRLQITQMQIKLNDKKNELFFADQRITTLQQRLSYLDTKKSNGDNINTSYQDDGSIQRQNCDLKQTIMKFTEHIEEIEVEKQKYSQQLIQKEQENSNLITELNKLYNDWQQIHTKNEQFSHLKDSQNIVDRQIYNDLLRLYGKKSMQVVILLSEVNRLNTKCNEDDSQLKIAEEKIAKLNKSYQQNIKQLNIVQDQYKRKFTVMAHQSQLQATNISKMNKQFATQIANYNTQIEQLKKHLFSLTSIQKQLNNENVKLKEERNHLLKKLSEEQNQRQNNQRVMKSNQQMIYQLKQKVNSLNLQLSDTTTNLKMTQSHIEKYQASSPNKLRKVQDFEAQEYIKRLIRDCDVLKAHNQQLKMNMDNYENIMKEHRYYKNQYQKMMIVLKQFEPASPSRKIQLTDSRYYSQMEDLTKSHYQQAKTALREAEKDIKQSNPEQQMRSLQNSRIKLQQVTEQLQQVKRVNISTNLRYSPFNLVDQRLQIAKEKESILNASRRKGEEVRVTKTNLHVVTRSTSCAKGNDVLSQSINNLKEQNKNLLEQLNQKDEYLNQIKELLVQEENSLKSMTQQFNQVAAQLTEAHHQIEILKSEIAKVPELQEYIQRDLRNIQIINRYENQIKEIGAHLEAAERYILHLEEKHGRQFAEQSEQFKLHANNEQLNIDASEHGNKTIIYGTSI